MNDLEPYPGDRRCGRSFRPRLAGLRRLVRGASGPRRALALPALSCRTATKTEPTISAAPTPVVSVICSSSSTAPSTIATSGFTYWCVTTFEIGAFPSSQAYAVKPISVPA